MVVFYFVYFCIFKMAYGRKKGTKRVYRRANKRRAFVRRGSLRRNRKGVDIHFFKRTFVAECSVTNAGWQNQTTLGAYSALQLQNVPGYAEFTAMYDMYKICGIKQKFVFNRTSTETSGSSEMPQLITVNDFNDSTALANEAEALEYASYKASRLDKPRSRYYRPSINITVPNGTSGMSSKSRWLNTTEVDIDHFGLKPAVDTISTATGTTIGTLRIYYTFYLAFKGKK